MALHFSPEILFFYIYLKLIALVRPSRIKLFLVFWLKSYCKNLLVYLCCSILRRTQSLANLPASDYEIYMACLLVATVYWHTSLQFVKRCNITLLSCLFMILFAVSMITLCYTTSQPDLSSVLYIFPILLYQLHDKRDTYQIVPERNLFHTTFTCEII